MGIIDKVRCLSVLSSHQKRSRDHARSSQKLNFQQKPYWGGGWAREGLPWEGTVYPLEMANPVNGDSKRRETKDSRLEDRKSSLPRRSPRSSSPLAAAMEVKIGNAECTATRDYVRAVGNPSISSAQEPKAAVPSALKIARGGDGLGTLTGITEELI